MKDSDAINAPGHQWASFLGVDPHSDGNAVSILPVPYDGTSTWKKGADRGPAAMLEASVQVELLDLPTETEPHRAGIETLDELRHDGDPEAMVDAVAHRVSTLLEAGTIPVVLGGEHSVSIGAIRAAAAHVGSSGDRLGVVQIDAHGDTRESYRGSRFNHACVMARAREVADIVQVGIRSLDRSELDSMDRSRVFAAHRIIEGGDDDWMDRAIDLVPDHVYLTIDLDAFDPSVMPATGTPEPGGLDWRTVNEFIHRLARRRTIVGFDVVELLPHPAHWACDFLAAKLVHRVIAELLAGRDTLGSRDQESST